MDVKTKTTYVVSKPYELDGEKHKVGSKVQLTYLEAGYWLTGGFLTPEPLVLEPTTEQPSAAPTDAHQVH